MSQGRPQLSNRGGCDNITGHFPKAIVTDTETPISTGRGWPFRRSTSDRMVAGVAGGIAARLGVSPVYVRAGFVCLSLAAGVGVVLYLLAVLLVPGDEGVDPEPAHLDRTQLVGVGAMFLAVMLILQSAGLWLGPVVWPAILIIFGLAIAIDTAGVNYERSLAGITDSRRSLFFLAAGLLMMIAGLVVVFSSLDRLRSVSVILLAILVAVGGFAIVAGPWMWSLIEDLRTERRARIRSEERADMAAHLHDSVLQTLALIQRTDDPKRMVTLARKQERDLRSWLFEDAAADDRGLKGALEDAATQVEEVNNVPVSVVVVGESTLEPDRQAAIVGAATEAMMNAAKHSGADRVSVFAEATETSVDIFVTDQGKGFDIDGVEEDRRGISDSIRRRMQRHGGTATIESEVGTGTEVHLSMEGGTP